MTYTQTYTNSIEKIRELKAKNQELKKCWQNSVTECQEQKQRIAELEFSIEKYKLICKSDSLVQRQLKESIAELEAQLHKSKMSLTAAGFV